MRLSAIDILWPRDVVELVPLLDRLGYCRFWTTEHHTPRQSASPAVMAAVSAGLTGRMRVGAAGVMLRLYSALEVAEDFRLLELLYPGRIDLGVVGAVPPEPLRTALLDGRPLPDDDTYAGKVAELARLVSVEPAERHLTRGEQAGPCAPTAPQLWLCGTSRDTAALAARLGLRFAYHDHQHPGRPDCGPAVVDAYRLAFRPSNHTAVPTVNVVCYGMCAHDQRSARRLWFPALGVPPNFIGDPDRCREQLLEIGARYGVAELVVHVVAAHLPARLDGYRLLADAFDLPRHGE